MTLVDTSSWIQYLRRDGEAEMKEKVRSLLLDGAAVLCPVVIAELGHRGQELIIDILEAGIEAAFPFFHRMTGTK